MKLSLFILLVVAVSSESRTIDETLVAAQEDGSDVTSVETRDITGDSATLHDLDMMLTEEQMRELFNSEESEDLDHDLDGDLAPPLPPSNNLNTPLGNLQQDLNSQPITIENLDHQPSDMIDHPPPPPPGSLSVDQMIAAARTDVTEEGEMTRDIEGGLDNVHDMDMKLTDEQRQLLFGYIDEEKADAPRITQPTTTTTTTSAPTTRAPARQQDDAAQPCEDANQHCFFARKNRAYCDANIYVKMYCRKSCGICDIPVTDECSDVMDVCEHLRGQGYCEGIFQEFMFTVCKKTCDLC